MENPRRIEAVCGKNAPFGNIIVDLVKSIPILHLRYEIIRTGKQFVKIVMTINAPYKRLISQEDFDPYTTYHVVVGDSNNKLLFKRLIKPYSQDKNLYFSIPTVLKENFPVTINIVCDKFIGLDKKIVINDENDITAEPVDKKVFIDPKPLKLNVSDNIPKQAVTDDSVDLDDPELLSFIKELEKEEPKTARKPKKKKTENIKDIKVMLTNMKKKESDQKTNLKCSPKLNTISYDNLNVTHFTNIMHISNLNTVVKENKFEFNLDNNENAEKAPKKNNSLLINFNNLFD
jgi:hypothetical protein